MQRLPPLSRRVKIGLAVAGALMLVLLVAFGPIVRAKAASQAERRGIELEIGAVRPGFGRVWLRELTLKIPEIPALEVRLDAVEVGVGPLLGVRRVVAHGGQVVVRGSPAEVEKQVRAWRARRASESGSGRGPKYVAEGLNVVWLELGAEAPPQHVWGARYERSDDGGELLGADRAHVSVRGASIDVENASLALRRVDGRRVIERVAADALLAVIDLDALPISRGVKVDRDLVKPVSARVRATTPGAMKLTERLNGWVPIDPGRGPRLREKFGRIAQIVADALPESGELDLSGVRLRVRRGSQGVGIGPARLHLTRTSDNLALSLRPGAGSGEQTALEVGLDVPLQAGPVKIAVNGGPVSLAALGVQNGDLGLARVDAARLQLTGKALLAADGRGVAWEGRGKLSAVTIEQKWLAGGPVSGLSLGFRGKGELSLDGSRFDLMNGELDVGQVRAELSGLVERTPEWTKATLRGGVPLASCQAMLDSAPRGLVPLLDGMKLSGTFSLAGSMQFDTRALDRMTTEWSDANECRITATPADVAPTRFQQPWTRKVKDANGRVVDLETGPGTPGWVPRFSISKHMETAVLICEDGAFFRHKGFDREAIRNSIRENVKAGRFLRGASTISMQLAKNLYLSREKTLARKLEEAVLTMLLEQELSKDQIMELYLNVIEFGPGIYGVGPAAQHYFNAQASQLSLGQALYLGSILPSPSKSYFGADGQVTPGWMAYLRKLMRIALKIHRVDESELDDGLREQVTFQVPYSPRLAEDPDAATAGKTVDEAQFGPIAPGDGEEH